MSEFAGAPRGRGGRNNRGGGRGGSAHHTPHNAHRPPAMSRDRVQPKRNKNNLDVNIDGKVKNDIWQKLKVFQEDPTATKFSFPPNLSNTDRRYVHTACKNLNLTSKSEGGKKGSATRYVVVYKTLEEQSEKEVINNIIQIKPATKQEIERLAAECPLQSLNCISHKQAVPHVSSILSQLAALKVSGGAAQTQTLTPVKPALNASLQADFRTKHNIYDTTLPLPAKSLSAYRRKLPTFTHYQEIINAILNNQVIVLSGNTGTGKSTQIPQYILDYYDSIGEGGNVSMIVTQPRRLSAVALSQRVAQERGEPLGASVGYQIRMESTRSASTRILYCTIGVLLRRLVSDPTVRGVSHIIVDEVHERDRLADFLLIILRDILPLRPDLKVILMSATLNASLFSNYFTAAPIINIPGFTYQVHTFYLEDVIELTGYQFRTPNKQMSARIKAAVQNTKEKDLQQLLMNSLESELEEQADANGVNAPATGSTTTITTTAITTATAFSTPAAAAEDPLAALNAMMAAADAPSDSPFTALNSFSGTQAAVGWTDSWQYRPEEEGKPKTTELTITHNPAANNQLQLNAVITHVNSSDVTTNFQQLRQGSSSPVITDTHDQYQRAAIAHSADTVETVAKIEQFGMDFIDYNLVIDTIKFICTRFSEDEPRYNNRRPAKKQAAEDEDIVTTSNGSILVFLPGWEDITSLLDLCAADELLRNPTRFLILPLHGMISTEQQRLIFSPPKQHQRKIIFSTNVAETSITIDDVVFVIDCGKVKEKTYDAFTKMSALNATWISRANAKQRSGRAGRSRRGVCFRLYTEKMYESMEEFQTPEMLRTPLEEICLQIKMLGLGKYVSHFACVRQRSCGCMRQFNDCVLALVLDFAAVVFRVMPFLQRAPETPPEISIGNAITLLTQIGALDKDEELTYFGKYLALLPMDPRLARMLIFGLIMRCLDPIVTIAAALSYRDPFILPFQFERDRANAVKRNIAKGVYSDMILLLNAYGTYAVLRQQNYRACQEWCKRSFINVSSMDMIHKMREQYLSILLDAGLLPAQSAANNPSSGFGVKNQIRYAPIFNQQSANLEVINFVVCFGMYPCVARVQQAKKKKHRPHLCTRDALTHVFVHPSSVCRTFPKTLTYVNFFESVRSSEIFLRNVHWISNVMLSIIPSYSSSVKQSEQSVDSESEEEEEEFDEECEDEEDLDEWLNGDDDDIDDLDVDEESLPLGGSGGGSGSGKNKNKKKNRHEVDLDDDMDEGQPRSRRKLQELKLDNWINFYLSNSDYEAVIHIRNYITALIDLYVQHSYHIHVSTGTEAPSSAAAATAKLASTVVPRILSVITNILEGERVEERNEGVADEHMSATSPSPMPFSHSPSPAMSLQPYGHVSLSHVHSARPHHVQSAGFPRGRDGQQHQNGGYRGRGGAQYQPRPHSAAQQQQTMHAGASTAHSHAVPTQFIPPQVRTRHHYAAGGQPVQQHQHVHQHAHHPHQHPHHQHQHQHQHQQPHHQHQHQHPHHQHLHVHPHQQHQQQAHVEGVAGEFVRGRGRGRGGYRGRGRGGNHSHAPHSNGNAAQ